MGINPVTNVDVIPMVTGVYITLVDHQKNDPFGFIRERVECACFDF